MRVQVNYDLKTGDILEVNNTEWLVTNTYSRYVIARHKQGNIVSFKYSDLLEWKGLKVAKEPAEIQITEAKKGLKFGDRVFYNDFYWNVVEAGEAGKADKPGKARSSLVTLLHGYGKFEVISYADLEEAGALKLHL